ncbi:3725_t:CDS:2 [Racocetra fulgida]|uniref:3725_t:CDS:1 n=1 Tax=Racocetra fulgida TaxID=60492 RepID=A0A9N8ZYX3_9GLOM|nr:3725_t:CDS:2 [Racocetra fulgida]
MTTFAYNATNSSLWLYNINSQTWDVPGPGTNGPPLLMRRSTATTINKDGVIFILGGRVKVDTGSEVFTIFDEFFTFDTLLLKWTNLTSLPNHPYKRSHATATLMPDGKIIYIGGVTQSIPGEPATRISMNEVIILGGCQSYGLNQTISYPVFVLLDVSSETFQYSSPQPSGISPPPLSYHTATLYQSYMIVAFGNDSCSSNNYRTFCQINLQFLLKSLPNYAITSAFNATFFFKKKHQHQNFWQ